MITHNFSFYGAGGRVSRLDASRIYSTPLTTQAEKDYSIDVDLSEYGQLAAVTLDGRLWLFQDANSLDFVALRWDSSKGQMVFAETLHFDGEGDTVLARGLDWILTNRNIFMVNDSAPYIRQASLFDKNIPSTFLYSALRHSSVPVSGADPFTKQAWGKRDDNGNSGGNARFSRDTHLLYPAGTHTFEQCYSLLPAVGDWIIFENFLIRRPDNPLTEHFNYMLNVRPLIPLELLDEGAAAFGTGYNFDHRGIQLAYLYGQLWGRGLYHIGKVYIFPNSFDENGNPQGYYLYISQDFPNVNSALDVNSSWLHVALASLGENNLYGFLASEPMPVTGGACITAENSDILDISGDTPAWQSLSDNHGKLVFDYSNQNALLLDDEGAQVFLNGLTPAFDYKCHTLRQWLAPADNLDAVCETGVIASADRTAFFSNFQRGFHREVFSPCSLPLSATAYTDEQGQSVRLSASAQSQGLDIKHSIAVETSQNSILWQDFYKEPISLDFAYFVDRTEQVSFYSDVVFYPPASDSSYPMDEGSYDYGRNRTPYRLPLCYKINSFSVLGMAQNPAYDESTAIYQVTQVGPNYDGSYSQVQFSLNGNSPRIGIVLACSATCSYIDPASGLIKSFDLNFEANPEFEIYSHRNTYSLRALFHEIPDDVVCVGDDLGFMCYVYSRSEGYFNAKVVFYPITPIPEDLRRWIDHSLYPYGTFQSAMLCPVKGVTLLPFVDKPQQSVLTYSFWGSSYEANAYFHALADAWEVIVRTVAHKVPFALHFSPPEDILSLVLRRLTADLDPYWFLLPDNYKEAIQDDSGNLWASQVAIVALFNLDTFSPNNDGSDLYVRDTRHFALTFHVRYNNLILHDEDDGILL